MSNYGLEVIDVRKRKLIREVKGKKGQQLNQREVNAISEGTVEGLLLFDVDTSGFKTNLTYNTEGLIPLSEFLHLQGMNRRLFVVLLRHIALILKGIEKNRFSKDLLMWTAQAVYIDPSTWRVYMMYVPLQPFESTGNLKSFLLEAVAQCNFEAGEDIGYVQMLVQDLNSVTAYTVGMLESYCDKVAEALLQQKGDTNRSGLCPACGSKVNTSEEICPFCGKRLLSRSTNTAHKNTPTIDSEFWPETVKKSETDAERQKRSDISVNKDENGVVTVFRGSQRMAQSVWLEDCSREGKIIINKFPFRVGKMEGVTDYRIFNNNVSRKHADIIKDQGKFYVVDLGSTNGTYLNGRRTQPGVKELLNDGSIIRFANEEFKFHID